MTARDKAIQRELANLELLANATPAPSPALLRITDALRRLGRFAASAPDHPDTIEPVARALESALESLPADARDDGTARESRFDGELDPTRPLPNQRGTHPLLGSVSPVAPPLELRVEDGRVVADVEFDVRYEGNRGWVHGGYVAAGFDVMAVAGARLSGRSGPSGTINVRFVNPTPVGEPLRYVCWPENEEGRKVFVRGHLERCADGKVTAELDGIVVALG